MKISVTLRIAITTALAAGCTGTIDGELAGQAPGSPESGFTGGPAAGPAPAGAGGVATPGGGGAPPATPPTTGAPAATDPPASFLRRLTNDEYRNTLRDLVGLDASAARRLSLPGETRPAGAFDTSAEFQTLTVDHLRAYAEAAGSVVAGLVGTPARLAALVKCDAAADRTCLATFVRAFGRRAYRRPLADDEVKAYVDLAATEAAPLDGVALALRAMLQSPSFLYRVELGVPAPERPGLRRLGGYEIATRLSYTFLRTTPPDTLLDQAEKGALDTPDSVEKATRELLADPRARDTVRSFLTQWTGVDTVGQIVRTPAKFPDFTSALRTAMAEEPLRVAEDLIWSERGDFRALLDARHTFVNAALAKTYGLPAPASGWQRVDFPADLPRAGIVTAPVMLALHGRENGTSALYRGLFVRTGLMCGEMPPPPADVPSIDDVDPRLPERERLARHRADPACSGCHQLMDPIGHGLARFDPVGAYRATDAAGKPIADDGELVGTASGAFQGGVELAAKLRAAPETAACTVKKLAAFFLGRSLHQEDAPLERELAGAYGASGSVREVIVALARSTPFRYRKP